MNIFNRLFNRSEDKPTLEELPPEETRAALDTEIVPEVDSALLRALVGTNEITPETALEIPTFSAAVDFIANTIAMLPVKLYREIPEEHKTEEITDDRRLFLLNDEANSVMSAYDAKRAQIRDMLINGAGYLYINEDSLHYVRYGDVSVTGNSDPIFRDFDIFVGGRRYYPFDFVILTRGSSDGITGIGAVREHKTLLSAMYNTLKYENTISRTGGNKKGFLQSEHKLSNEAFDKMKRAWEELYANNGNNMMLLNDGVKYVPSASTSVEMQLNENKRTNSEQIAAIFGLSPEIISGTADTQTYMSAIRTAVIPVVEAYQAALNKSLLRESEKGRLYFTLDTTELLKGDTLSRYQAYAIGLKNNFLQIDEVRYLEDKEPIGFNYIKLGLQDVLLDPKTGAVYTPNTNQTALVGELTNPNKSGIPESDETRGKDNWIKGEHGYFKGSTPSGGSGGSGGGAKKDLTNGGESGIINTGSDDVTGVTISSIDSPIEQKHTGKGNPNAIVHFDVELNNRQQALLNALPEYDSRITVPRDSVNMTDLSALTAKTGNEFAMFTKGGNRLVIRGNEYRVNIDVEQAKELAAQGYKWSGHTHPGTSRLSLFASDGDKAILKAFGQETSVVYNSQGRFLTFNAEE